MRILSLLLLLASTLSAQAGTSLWRVTDGRNQLFIGGTIHVLSAGDFPLPDEFEQAFRESDVLVLETDLDALTSPEAVASFQQQLTYTAGKSLKQTLKPETYRRLRQYCKRRQIPLADFSAMQPSLVSIALAVAEMNRLGITEQGVDEFFYKKAQAAKKEIKGLETHDRQIKTLAQMGAGQEDDLILSTLEELDNTSDFTLEIKQAWRQGNLDLIENLGNTSMKDFPALRQSVLTQRNDEWLGQIKSMLSTPQRELILVGSLHLAGKDGLLTRLKSAGYRIEQY